MSHQPQDEDQPAMAVDKEVRGPLWVDGQFTVRVRGPGPEPGRVVRIRRPFALIGQLPGADIRIDDPAVDGRHAFLLLDHRGIFGVDLLSRTGTRFAGVVSASAWLGVGDIIEIAGRRVELLQLRIDGTPIDPPRSNVDLLADSNTSELVELSLEPLDSPGPPWMLGSALAFVGRGEACAIQIDNASASKTHCTILRDELNSYVIDLLGRLTLINERPIDGASAIFDGDILTIGQARFLVRIDRPSSTSRPARETQLETIEPVLSPILNGLPELYRESHELMPRSQETMFAMFIGTSESDRDPSRLEFFEMLRRFQADTAAILEAQIARIETLNCEIASLREELRNTHGTQGPLGITATPLRLDLRPPQASTSSEQSATWLIDRLNTLETESRSTWKDLFGRLTSTVTPRSRPSFDNSPDESPSPTDPKSPPATNSEVPQDRF